MINSKMLAPSQELPGNELIFENSSLEIVDEQLKDILLNLEKAVKEIEQINLIKQIVGIHLSSIREKGENVETKNCILEFFTRYNSKKTIKKYLQDVVTKNDLTKSIIEGTAKELTELLKHKKCNTRQCTNLLNFVYYLHNSPTFDYERLVQHLFPLYYLIFEGFVDHSKSDFQNVASLCEEIFALLNVVLKQILSVFVRDVPYINIICEEYSTKLILLSHAVIEHKKIGFDIKIKAGLVLTHSFNVIPEKLIKKMKYKECPALELLKEHNNEKVRISNHELTILEEPEHLVIIYASILNVMPKDQMYSIQINDKSFICILYEGLLESAKRTNNNPPIIVEISRTLAIISKHMKDIPLELMELLFLYGLTYIWSHIEHFVDSVRNYTRLFLIELVVVAAHHKSNGHNLLSDILLANVKLLNATLSVKFLALEYIAMNMSCIYLLENFRTLPDDLLKLVSQTSVLDEVCKCYIALMEKHFQEVSEEVWLDTWIMPAISLMSTCTDCSPASQKIITKAFPMYPALLRKIFPNEYDIVNAQECVVLLKCLHYARMNGIELKLERNERTDLYWRGLIDKPKLESFMIHQDDNIRISVLSVLVDCQKSTEAFLNWELNFLTKYLQYNITSQLPYFRKQMVTYYTKALARVKAGYHVICRHVTFLQRNREGMGFHPNQASVLTVYEEMKAYYVSFLEMFSKYLISNLTFDSNFCRRSVSLDLLNVIQGMIPLQQWLYLWTEDDVKNCHSILFDSYECNKKAAAAVLKKLPFSAIGFTNIEFTFNYMQRCLDLAMAIKPSKTLSAAYLLEVCANSPFFYDIVNSSPNLGGTRRRHNPNLDMIILLTDKLIAQTNGQVDLTNPSVAIYGLILSIRYLLRRRDLTIFNEAYSGLFEHLTNICLFLKDHLMPIVCNPSPEGYLPDAEILCETDESAKAQMILVYAWRTIKEMTLMLAEIIRQTVKLECTYEMLSEDLMIKIGEFFVDIFVCTKHKGVFEQAFVSFSVVCDSFFSSANLKLNVLPIVWLQSTLKLCTGERELEAISATRRSAGLPFLILAIIGAEPVLDKNRFHNVMTKLFQTCESLDENNIERRMHCMNVLRAIYRHSRLGEVVAAYIAKGVIVAVTGFKSDTWGVRNSATLLYAALITRMFGVQRTQDSDNLSLKNRLTVRVFFLRYPELFQFLLDTLGEECDKSDSLLLHPVLTILARLYPSQFEDYNKQMATYLPYLTTCLSNPVYRTRELAARALVSFLGSDETSGHFDNIFDVLRDASITDNQAHGFLMQVLYILKSKTVPDVPITKYFEKSIRILKLGGKKFSHMTTALYMEVIMLFLMEYPEYEDLDMLKAIVSIISKEITCNLLPMTSMSKFSQSRFSLLLYIILNKFEENELTFTTITNQIMCQLYGHDLEMKKYCLNLLICLNETHGGYKHPLYRMEELQMPADISNLVRSFDKCSITKILLNTHQYLKFFLTKELKNQHYIRDEDQVLLYILLSYYPCIIKQLNLSKQETLNVLIAMCFCDNEELISAVITCISSFLLQMDYNVLQYDKLVVALSESASPASSDYRRMAVCDFLIKNYILYCNEDRILLDDDHQMFLCMVMILLEDDELMIRNAMSEFMTILRVRITLGNNPQQTISGQRWPIIPEKAREDLLTLSTIVFRRDRAIGFLFSWTCRHFPDTSSDASVVFERGELNTYAENVPFLNHCEKLIRDLLWTLEDGLNYADRSIFIEEHTLMATTILLDSVEKYPSPMMLCRSKVSVVCALKSTINFLEHYELSSNFSKDFEVYLNEKIMGYLTAFVEHCDLSSVKWIIRKIYGPVLKTGRVR